MRQIGCINKLPCSMINMENELTGQPETDGRKIIIFCCEK